MIVAAKARLVQFRELGPEVRHFVFEAPEVEGLEFTPGQWVSLTGRYGGKEITRAYSIASPPDGNRFELCLNRVREGAFSPHLFAMQPGDAIELKGPFGTFLWRQPMSDSVLVATGTGIAPFRSMLLDYFWRQPYPGRRITLVFGVRYEQGLLYREEFEAIARDHADFAFWPTLSRPDAGWTGRSGHVQPHALEAVGERRDLDVYICGLKAMVDDVRAKLKSIGLERRRIIYEKYD